MIIKNQVLPVVPLLKHSLPVKIIQKWTLSK